MSAQMKPFTVWLFASPTANETNIAVRGSEPDDLGVQHRFQRVLWRGDAYSAGHALVKFTAKARAAEELLGRLISEYEDGDCDLQSFVRDAREVLDLRSL